MLSTGSKTTTSSTQTKPTLSDQEAINFKNGLGAAKNRVLQKNQKLDSDATSFYNYVISADPNEIARGFANVKDLFRSAGKSAPNDMVIKSYLTDYVEKGPDRPLTNYFGSLVTDTGIDSRDIISSFENRRISGGNSVSDYYKNYEGLD